MLSTGSAQTDAKSSNTSSSGKFKTKKEIVSYWGIEPNKIAKEDGTEWKWTSFRVISFFHYVNVYIMRLKQLILFANQATHMTA